MKKRTLSVYCVRLVLSFLCCSVLVAGCGKDRKISGEPDDTDADYVDDTSEDDIVDDASEDDTLDDTSEDDIVDEEINNSDSANTDSTSFENGWAAGIGRQDENDPNFNHGHSISETSTDRPREIKRSYDVLIHDSMEALEYLEGCITLQSDEYSFVLTDTSDKDKGAYMWYEFTAFYENIPIEGASFTVIAFNDGTIAEGRTEILSCTIADSSKALSVADALARYAVTSGDTRRYVYQKSEYFFTGRGNAVCPYAYVYRYDCGRVLDNITLVLDAETGEMIGYWPDAID